MLELSDGGREHGPTVITALALQRAGALGVRERRVAFRWLVGCIPRPLASTTEAKACAMEALRLGASGLRQARTVYGEAQELFIEAEDDATCLPLSSTCLPPSVAAAYCMSCSTYRPFHSLSI